MSGRLYPQDTPPCQNLGVEQSELDRGYTYQEGGLDWDNATWSCIGGSLQSPINFPSPSGARRSLRHFNMLTRGA